MSWSTPEDLRSQVQRWWDRGELLRATVSEGMTWPARLTLKTPGAADLSDRFEAVREWVPLITAAPQIRIEWRQWKHRVQGMQSLPKAAWLDTPQQALALIGKTTAAQRFVTLWQQTATTQPLLLPWLLRRPLHALAQAEHWEAMLAVVGWLQVHPRPGVYLRQIDAPGVDSKFIEAHRGVLTELLDLALPPEAIDTLTTGVTGFNRRFGFLDKPVRIRFRLLDPMLSCLPGCTGLTDLTLDAASFATLALPVARVFITENETNFLAFPPCGNSIVIFGAGYGWEALSRAAWLQRCRLYYWGDIDTHGFAILDQLRPHFPHVTSFLMDRETLLAHRLQWGTEASPARHELPRLTTTEVMLYDDIRFDRLHTALRLEQEQLSFDWIGKQLELIDILRLPS